jgi:hypothetical protein
LIRSFGRRPEQGDEAGALAVFLVEGQPIQAYALGPGPVDLLQGDLPLGAIDDRVGDTRLPAARAVGRPRLRQVQLGVEQDLVRPLADAEVHRDDAIVDLADAAEVLTLYAGRLGSLLDGTGLVDEPDGAQFVGGQARQQRGSVPLELAADGGNVPDVVLEELLQGADGGAGLQGDRLDALARQVGEQAADIGAQMGERLRVVTAEQVVIEEARQGRPKSPKLLLCHEDTSTRAEVS